MIEIIDRVVDRKILEKAARHFADKGIILPTFAQQKDPSAIPGKIKDKLRSIGLWELHPLNLFRITWKNDPREKGGLFPGVNYIELPGELTGVDARIITLLGRYFPTGAHKVGAAYGCLAPRIVTGAFDPSHHKAVWPSTGNYCRGGAFDSYLMGCDAVAILPEEMSRERFEWLKEIGAEVIATPGCESNVKEIYDKCWELRRTRPDCMIFNQFDQFGNAAWHYNVTGAACAEVYAGIAPKGGNLAAFVSSTGSAGTIAAADYLKTLYPRVKTVAAEALQCPTLLWNGFGGHRIEGIGDKHVPWIHNVKNTDLVTAIDDEDCLRLLRLFNEDPGKRCLREAGVDAALVENLNLLGISSIANLLAAVETARYYELTAEDVILTVATDSADMYRSRLEEMGKTRGDYTDIQAGKDLACRLHTSRPGHLKELTYIDRKAIHNLKYYTWVEQQSKEVEDLNDLWYDRDIWSRIYAQPEKWDPLIEEFNDMTGLLKKL